MESVKVAGLNGAEESVFSSQDIEHYYEQSKTDYRLLWNYDRSHALHFGFWTEDTRTLSQALENENRILACLAEVNSGDHILDAGCGVGGSAVYLARNYGCKVHGVSLCEHQLERASQLSHKYNVQTQLSFAKEDYHKLQWPSESFSIVWCIESFCHSWNKPRFLREAHRLLRPGGQLIIADGFRSGGTPDEEQKSMMRSWLDGWAVPDLPGESEMGVMLGDAGFGPVQMKDFTDLVIRSSRRLYDYSRIFYPAARFASIMGMRKEIQNANLRAARDQYLTLKANLWKYSVVRAWK